MRNFHGKDVGEIFDLGRLMLLRAGRGHVPTPKLFLSAHVPCLWTAFVPGFHTPHTGHSRVGPTGGASRGTMVWSRDP